MQATYTLDTKIQALNLLDQFDNDFHRVKAQLEIPLKTLRGWLADADKLRLKYDDRQFRHFANIKLELLGDMLESSRDIMKKIKSGDHEGISLSQLTYALSTLLNHSKQLEDNFEDLASDTQNESEQPNRIRYVDEYDLMNAQHRADENPQQTDPLQNSDLPEELGQIGIEPDGHPEGDAAAAQTPPVDRPQPPHDRPNLARARKRQKARKKRRHRQNRKARRSAKR
ncbi:MAG: hypothetical protein OXG39_01410 [Chloroflexi bacterium]|nr:hypothetical protein [Chloroflexota bacterium]